MILKSKSKSSTQNDLIKNHTDDLKSRFKIIRFEIIPNTAEWLKLLVEQSGPL